MFSGIIQAKIQQIEKEKKEHSITLCLPIPHRWHVSLGESISIDGICSTVKEVDATSFTVYWMDETVKKTTVKSLPDSHFYNLEKCLTLQSLIGGHLVTGHIDTVGKVEKIENIEESRTLTFSLSPAYTKYIIYKGSIAVNGVSLTIVSVTKDFFTVSLIPYTLEHTNLGELKPGDSVNIEVDMIAKYVERLHSLD